MKISRVFSRVVIGFVIISVSIFCLVPTVHASDYTIYVDDGSLSKNTDIIFEENNIGPGFISEEYPITINNRSTSSAKVSLVSITPVSSNPNDLLPGVSFFVSDSTGHNVVDGNITSLGRFELESNCIAPGSEETAFYTRFSFDRNLGNEFQNTSFKVQYTFLVTADNSCDLAPPTTGAMPPSNKSAALFSWLPVIIVAAGISALFFLILIIKRRKEDEATKVDES